MADWFCSSAAYAGYAAFVGSHAYNIGDIVVPTAPALKAKWVFRCTTAGTSSTEPAWPTTNNGTVTTGTATFTNITGQSTYGWSAAAGDLASLVAARIAGGDRVFLSSDHSETQSSGVIYGSGGAPNSFALIQFLSVNRAGSVPPAAADLTAGATITNSGATSIEHTCPTYHYGITYAYTGAGAASFTLGNGGYKSMRLSNCVLYVHSATTTDRLTNSNPADVILDNTTVKFDSNAQAIGGSASPFTLRWINGGGLGGATFPTVLFSLPNNVGAVSATIRGVDLSSVTGTLVQNASSGTNCGGKFLFDACKIASGVTRYSATNAVNTLDLVELANCYDGTNIVSERYTPAGTLTTERTITLSGGATDDVGTYSHKLLSTANVDKYVNSFESFWLDVENTATGSPKTATVEIISSTALNNDEISLDLEYEGTAGSALASFANSLPATVLTTAAAVTTSTATWNSSPATPQKQKLQVSFTPQTAGRVRGLVRLGKASATCYINPQITIT